EAVRRDGPQDALLEILPPAVRIDDRPVREPARDRVHREVTPSQIVFDGCRGIDDDLEILAAGPGRHLATCRCELDPGPHPLAHARVARIEPHTDRTSCDDELFGAPM